MKFENKGKWIKEAEDKLAARDTMEDPDYLNGDNKVLTFEDDELEDVPSDEEFEDEYLDETELDSPEEEEMALAMAESSQKNEAKLGHRHEIDFDSIGGGFEVEMTTKGTQVGISLQGYSNNTSKNIDYFAPEKVTFDDEKLYDDIVLRRNKLLPELKALADKFDKDVIAVLAKYKFKK